MFSVHDKKVNEEISKLQIWMKEVFGIENASKEDAIRYLLKMKKEKNHPTWDSL